MALTIPASSTQYLFCQVTSPVDVTGTPPSIAFLADLRANPSGGDWRTAAWTSNQTVQFLIGPATGGLNRWKRL